jgi:hypothetical protein
MRNRRGALVALPLDAIYAILDLPPGFEVHHLFLDQYRDALCVAITSEHLDEVPEGCEMPYLPTTDWCRVVDTTPVLDALRKLHYPTDDGQCFHCEDEWPCPTMKVAEAEALEHPLAMRRIKVDVSQ